MQLNVGTTKEDMMYRVMNRMNESKEFKLTQRLILHKKSDHEIRKMLRNTYR